MYELKSGLSANLPCLASFDQSSFQERTSDNNASSSPLYGKLICMNTKQNFIDFDKKKFMDSLGEEIWRSILDGKALKEPEKSLSKFGLLIFGDLKRHKFTYFFAFPALQYPMEIEFDPIQKSSEDGEGSHKLFKPISSILRKETLEKFQDEFDMPEPVRLFQRSYFIMRHSQLPSGKDDIALYPLDQYSEALTVDKDTLDSTVYFAYADPCSTEYPGWPLRNLLSLITVRYQLQTIRLIRIRIDRSAPKSEVRLHQSEVFTIKCRLDPSKLPPTMNDKMRIKIPQVVGWERNENDQAIPKYVDLSSLLDPKKLADNAVNLNLRLMKWRLLPSLDLDKIASTKCLLLGCGALGCHIARGLLAWGVKDFSLVDNAKISYSNPVRQILYSFDDCSQTDKVYKAHAAAANLRKIHPTVNAKPYVFSIPMPGHQISGREEAQAKEDILTLENLIDENDVIFLLMDTRESRWLPTVIGLAKQKLVINAAIGFDTFLLQRHGIRDYQPVATTESISSQPNVAIPRAEDRLPCDQLGCYFCNDIVAPGDSTSDRTLDQQCTVSRPGVSMMVSALAVELFASILSSPMGPRTPAPLNVQNNTSQITDEDCDSELGLVPHSVRGSLSRYHIYMPTCPCFNKCSACSQAVVRSYINSGFDFLLKVFNDPNYLEEIAGLKDLQNFNENILALDSDDDVADFD